MTERAFEGESLNSFWNAKFDSLDSKDSLDQIVGDNANAVSLINNYFLTSGTSSTIGYSDNTDSLASYSEAILDAEARGLAVMVKPHIGSLDGTYSGDLAPTDPAAFFATYKTLLLQLATVAQADHAQVFSVGNEMYSLTGSAYRAEWVDIIDSIRQVYSGKITYAAGFYEPVNVSFLDKLDYIGVNAYIPLAASSNANPTVDQLVAAWTSRLTNSWLDAKFAHMSFIDYMHSLSVEYNKPVIITELGFRSVTGAAADPGDWATMNTPNADLQAKLYQAFFQVWSQQGSWFQGQFLFGMTPMADPATQDSTYATDYNTQGKAADAVITSNYAANGAADTTTTASGNASTIVIHASGHGTSGQANSVNTPILVVAVDGIILGTATVTGHGGTFDDYTFTTSDVDMSRVQVYFLNPGHSNDLYVDYIDVNGVRYQGEEGTNNATGGWGSAGTTFASLYATGSLTVDLHDTINMKIPVGRAMHTMSTLADATSVLTAADFGVRGTTPWVEVDRTGNTLTLNYLYAKAAHAITLNAGNGGDTIVIGGIASSGVAATITGGNGNDIVTLQFTMSANIHGGAGNDIITGSNGSNILYGDAGDDTLTGGTMADRLYGGDGNDSLSGGAGNDILDGGAGNNVIQGGAGNDAITVTTGNNELHGGDGNDTIHAGNGANTIYGDGGNNVIVAGNGGNIINADNGNNTITSGSGNDHITAGSGSNIIRGGDGNDIIHTGDGRTVIVEGSGADTITTGAGGDNISVGNGGSTINAGDGNNAITAGSGNDTIVTGSGNDVIRDGNGNDTIHAGAGNDSILAGNGADTIYGEGGNDSIHAGNGGNMIDGGDGNDVIISGTGNDTIYGGTGNDIIHGGAGDDIIYGGGGKNVLYGDAGNDTLVADDGIATMAGGLGADTFRITSMAAAGSSVADFSAAQGDHLDLSSVLTAYNPLTEAIGDFVHLTTVGKNTVVSVDQAGTDHFTNLVTLNGAVHLDLHTLVDQGHLIV